MRLWRIQKSRYQTDVFSGIAAMRYRGRWNQAARKVVYTATSVERAVLELSRHLDSPLTRENEHEWLVFPIDVPDFVSRERIRPETLPQEWTKSLEVTQALGEDWLLRAQTCLLEVPSAAVPGAANFLINPVHPDIEFLFARPAEPLNLIVQPPVFVPSRVQEPPATPQQVAVNIFGKKEIFLCHTDKDSDSIATPISEAFLDLGISCWTRSAEILVGDSVIEKINEGLLLAKYFVVLISPEFLRSPEHIQELTSAMARKKSHQIRKIFPIIVNYPGEDVDVATDFPMLADTRAIIWNGDALKAASAILQSMRAC